MEPLFDTMPISYPSPGTRSCKNFNSRFLPTDLNLLRSETFSTEHTLLTKMKSMITSGFLELNEVHCLKKNIELTYRSTFPNFVLLFLFSASNK